MRPRNVITPSTLALVLLAAACSSSGGNPPAASGTPMPTQGVVCAKDVQTEASIPSGFPSGFPFPPGTKIITASDRGDAGIVVTAVTDRPFPATLKFLNTDLPVHGYKLEDGESEPHDAESDWTSKSYEGRWAIREVPGCGADTSIQVVASPKK